MEKPEKGNIARRLVFSFCLLILIFLLFSLYSLHDIRKISDLTRTIYGHPLVVSNAALQSNISITKMHRNMKDVLLLKSLPRIQQSIATMDQEEQLAYHYLDIVRDKILGAEGKKLEKETRTLFDNWRPIRMEVMGLVRMGQRDKAAEITIGRGADHVAELEDKLLGLTNYARQKASLYMREAEKTYSRLKLTSIIILLVIFINSSLIAFFTIKQTASSEKKLRGSEERYRSLIESQTDLVCRFAPDGTFIFANDVFCKFFNKTKEALIGSKWQPLPANDDLEFIKKKLSDLSPTNPMVTIENRVISGTGDIHFVQFVNSGIFDRHKNLMEIQSVGRDITERMQAEKALTRSERKWRNILINTPQSGISLDPKARIIFANAHFLKLTGWEEQEVIGQNWFDLFIPENIREEIRNVFISVMSQKDIDSASSYENPIVTKTGDLRHMAWSNVLTKDAKGKTIDITCLGIDLTERIRAEEKLKKSEANYRLLVENQTDLVVKVDLEGRFLFVSPSYCRMFGKKAEALLGQQFMPLVHEEDQEPTAKAMESLFSPPYTAHIEQRALTENGWVWLAWQDTAVLDGDGNVKEIIGVGRDISNRKKAEREKEKLQSQLYQSQKIESIGTLAGGIAHDFNNILSSIIGYTELALDDIEKDTHIKDSLHEVYAAGIRARDLVKQILSISRHDEKEIKPIPVAPLIEEALKMLRSTIPTSIEFQKNICSEPLIVQADPTQLHQVVINLATNAKQAMADGSGVLEVGVDKVNFESDIKTRYLDIPTGNYARITVSDTGTGIQKKHLDKIFDPYFTTKEKGDGTGLGLSTVHGIVKSHSGYISVYSDLGKGTTFHVYLPLCKKRSVEHAPHTSSPLPTGTEHILLIDDEPTIVKMLQESLERLGYTVKTWTSSVDALASFRVSHDTCDLVITDMTMPKITGDKLAREVKAIRPDLPVIICTGFSEKISGHEENLDIDGFLMKPVDKTKMAKTIRNVLDDAKMKG